MRLIFSILFLAACSSKPVTTPLARENHPLLRVIVDDRVSSVVYNQVTVALMQSGRYEVLERQAGYAASVRETDRVFKNEPDKFDPEEKWLWYSKYRGGRGLIIPSMECVTRYNNWNGDYRRSCKQFISLVDGMTSRVIAAVSDEQTSSEQTTPEWTTIVEKLNESLPEHVEELEIKHSDWVRPYRMESARRAKEAEDKQYRDVGPEEIGKGHKPKLWEGK